MSTKLKISYAYSYKWNGKAGADARILVVRHTVTQGLFGYAAVTADEVIHEAVDRFSAKQFYKNLRASEGPHGGGDLPQRGFSAP